MAGPGNIMIRIGAETAGAVQGLNSVNKSLGSTMTTTEKMSAGLKKAALPAAAALTAIGIGAKKAVGDASALNEQMSKTATVFGPAGDEVAAWSKTLTKSFGLSSEAALESAGTFGNMLVPMGFARKDAATMSKQMVELAGDMASFNNASPEDTLAALSSGLAGQSEPLRKYGVFLDDARLKQEAMSQGMYDGKGAMDAQAKAAATYAIIMKDTADTQGDFAKTADGVANQTRIQAAEMENLSASLGQSLLPVMQQFQAILISVTGFAAQHTTAVKVLVGVIALLAGGIIAANVAMKAYAAGQAAVKLATAAWSAAQWLLNAALSANPIGLVIVAVAALAAGLVIAYKKSETFRNIVTAAMNAVKGAVDALGHAFTAVVSAATAAWNWITGHWQVALFAFGPLGAAISALVSNFAAVQEAAAACKDFVVGAFNAITGAINGAVSAIASLIDWIKKIPSKINLPHIPNPFLLPPAAGPAPYGLAVAGHAGSGTVTVNVYGAVDPEGTARAIRRILTGSDRRMGRA
jgi:hypothetical protein